MSQQNGTSTSAGPVSGRSLTQPFRSDATKPQRPSSTGRASSIASGLPRSGSQTAATVRSGRASLGATGSFPSRSAVAQGNSTAHGSSSVLSASSAAGGPGPAVSTSARQPGSAAAAATATATTPKGDGAHTPVPPAGSARFNPMYQDENLRSITPSVNTKAYTAKLSPQFEELGRQNAPQQEQLASEREASTSPWPAAAAANGMDFAGGANTSTSIRSGRFVPAKAAAGGSSSAAVPEKPPKPQNYLRTTGDLFSPPDQGPQEPSVVGVTTTTQLVSPGWNQHRPWLTGSWVMKRPDAFMREAGASTDQQQLPPLMALPPDDMPTAEYLLVDDLLTVMMGQAGQYIKAQLVEGEVYDRLGLWVQGAPNASLQEQVERLLPLCEYGHVIKRFVETRSQIQYPMVVQALAAAMRKLQEEWWVLVVQLEHQLKLGQLNLAALLYYCQAPAASLSLLANIAGEAAAKADLTSASLLNLLVSRQRSLAGDRSGQQLVGQLLEAAAEPYLGILRQWMCTGVLDDPYGEFMVKEDADVRGDSLTPEGEAAYWSMRYTIRRGVTDEFDVPVFLESSSEAILVTGKYLNVIRSCGQPVPPCPESTLSQLRYDAAAAERGSPPFLAGIQAALSAAAGALLAHMTGPQGRLLSWLQCLKHFFLLDQGDFLVHLMESGESESSTPLSALAPHQLQGVLDAALRSSSLAASPHVDVVDGAVAIKVDKRSILQLVTAATVSNSQGGQQDSLRAAGVSGGVSGWEDLMLALNTSWPLNLVVGKRQLLHYQVLFKQLLSLKHAEKQLGYVWQALRATKRLAKDDQARFRPWHLLCSQLQHVVIEVLRYTSIDVLEPLWADMYSRLVQAGNMDEVIQLHNAFLSAALERSLLMQAEVVQHIHNLLAAAKELSKVVESCDVQQSGTSAGGSSSKKQHSASQHHLQVLSMFCRQATRQDQLAQLQQKVSRELEALLKGLEGHHQQLSQAPLGPPASSFKTGGAAGRLMGAGQWRWGGSVAAVGDSSRELASLHNLIERLKLGEGSFEAEAMMSGY